MNHKLPDLSYAESDLAPYISAETLRYHYGFHHQGYVQNLNKLIVGTEWENKSLVDIVKTAAPGLILNNAAQHWNHSFYWACLTPKNGSGLSPVFLNALEKKFVTVAFFREEFTMAALSVFGSGWAWLVQDLSGELSIKTTGNADNPLRVGDRVLLTCDVWEHAYYIDYRNARAKYLAAFWELVDWSFVSNNFAALL
jgi:Fe-Mn family superoxide dismutase